jgi:hypothetical protein
VSRPSGNGGTGEPRNYQRSFDELASGLASGSISRGKALKLMGAALLGGTLASIPGLACAKPHKPDGAKCKRNKQCASGQCVDGVCGAACPADRPVLLSNGTCAKRCTSDVDCPGCDECSAETNTGALYCVGVFIEQSSCPSGTIQCPTGQFCVDRTGNCATAC